MQETDSIYRTKEALRAALLDLLCTSGIADVKAKDVAAGARVSRTTFYRYYQDVYDLLVDCFVTRCVSTVPPPPSGCTGEEFFAFLHGSAVDGAERAKRHGRLYLLCLECDDPSFKVRFDERVIQPAYETARRLVRLLGVTGDNSVIPLDRVPSLCVTLQTEIYRAWIHGGCADPCGQIADTINGVVIRLIQSINRCLWKEWQAGGVTFDKRFEV